MPFFPTLSTQQTQTHSRGHLHTNATLSGNSEEPAAWSWWGLLAGMQLSEAEGALLCLHLAIIQTFLFIMPMNKPQMFRVPSQPGEPYLAFKPLVTVLGSPVICPVNVGKKRPKVKTTKLITNVKESHCPTGTVSKHPCATWHQMSCQTLTK